MKKLITYIAELLLAAPICFGQAAVSPARTTYIGVPAGLHLKQYTYVPLSCGTACASVTTPAITIGTGDFVTCSCRVGAETAGFCSSSPSTSWSNLTPSYFTGFQLTLWYGHPSAGSTTFTCAPSSSQPNQSMVVLDFTGATVGTLNAQNNYGYIGSGSSLTSGSWTTSQRTIGVFCAANQSGSAYWSSGTIAGHTAIWGGASATNSTTNADQFCEYYIDAGSESSKTSIVIVGASQTNWLGQFGAWNY